MVEGEALAAGDKGPVALCSALLCMQLDVLVRPAAGYLLLDCAKQGGLGR